jgi:hypothetical protein
MNRQQYRQGKKPILSIKYKATWDRKGVSDDLEHRNILRKRFLLSHCVTKLFKYRIMN